jgi:hypothetical protein
VLGTVMTPMSYKDTVEYYYNTVLDLARQDSSMIFETLAIILDNTITYEDVEDVMIQWHDERKAIVEELRTIAF